MYEEGEREVALEHGDADGVRDGHEHERHAEAQTAARAGARDGGGTPLVLRVAVGVATGRGVEQLPAGRVHILEEGSDDIERDDE